MKFVKLTLLATLLSRIRTTEAIIGYDCSQHVSNLTTFSLIDVGECDIPEPSVNTTKPYIRLLQLNEFANIQVKLCKVEIRRSVSYCGAWSHRKDKNKGEAKFIDEVTKDECKRMHTHRSHEIRGEIISNLKLNGTLMYPMTFVGKVDQYGDCDQAGSYTDPYGTFEEAIVTGYVVITLQDYSAPVNLNTNEIVLRSGTRCKFNADACVDVEAGYAFWDPLPITTCEQNKYSELFAGYVSKITDDTPDTRPVYMVESEEITFAFSTVGTVKVCTYDLVRTEHPKLFILEGPTAQTFEAIKVPGTDNLDIFSYVNSKFVYVEKHIKGQVKRLYHDLIIQKCELERKVLTNALNIATSQPDLFALQVFGQKGHMGMVAGEVVHLMKCVQVDVQRRDSKACYQELPVTKDGKEYFLAPKTHILKQYGTETSCSGLVPSMFLLGDNWLTVLPNGATIGLKPQILKPITKSNWNYTEPANLAKSGIYTNSQIQALRQQLMFPVERPSMLNTIALGMSGRASERNGMSIARLFDEEALAELASNTWNKMWSQFMTFGSASAAVIGFVMIARLIKFLVDTIVHGYALYTIYGWSLSVIAAIWDSFTQLLLHAARDKPTRKQQKKEEEGAKQRENGATLSPNQTFPPPSPPSPPSPPPPAIPPPPPPVQYISVNTERATPPNTNPFLGARYTTIDIDAEGGKGRSTNIIENRLYPLLSDQASAPPAPPRLKRKVNEIFMQNNLK